MRWSAPGKLVLLGDYAVLEGARALVAAVDRRAVGRVDAEGPRTEVVEAVLARARAEGAGVDGVRIDTAGFLEPGGQKLGIGSSAAVAVVTAALARGRGDELTFEVALEGHRDAAGGVGSGVDLAASFYGGIVACRRQPAPVDVLPSRIRGLHLTVVWAGESASTSQLVRACRKAETWSRWMEIMTGLAEEGISAWAKGDPSRFLSVVARYGRAMAGLGRDAGVPVVTDTISAVLEQAEILGAAAKPSGAGGGDVVVIFSESAEVGLEAAARAGVRVIDLAIDPQGLRREP